MTHTFTVEIVLLATLVEAQLDALWEDAPATVSCCPHQCGPCGVIRRFLDDGTLDYILQFAVGTQSSAWWDEKEQRVDRAWLAQVWNCADQHEGEDDD